MAIFSCECKTLLASSGASGTGCQGAQRSGLSWYINKSQYDCFSPARTPKKSQITEMKPPRGDDKGAVDGIQRICHNVFAGSWSRHTCTRRRESDTSKYPSNKSVRWPERLSWRLRPKNPDMVAIVDESWLRSSRIHHKGNRDSHRYSGVDDASGIHDGEFSGRVLYYPFILILKLIVMLVEAPREYW